MVSTLKSEWLHKNKRKAKGLILFCNGWSMDARPLLPLGSDDWDVLMFYNYTDLHTNVDIASLFTHYPQVILVAWSMGVWAGNKVFHPYKKYLRKAIAINGTLCPVHDQFGIPVKVAQATCTGFDEKNRLKFYYRMCRDRVLYKRFLENQPHRSTPDQKEELSSLLHTLDCEEGVESIYDRVLIAEHDLVIPTQNQLNFWDKKIVRKIAGSHFLFYSYGSWDELVGQ